jgi:prevent-host-death family protein
MKEIQLKDAKATLSAVVDRAVAGEPTVITRHGRKEAVLVSFDEWERVSKVPSFADLLLAFPASLPIFRAAPQTGARVERHRSLTVYLLDTNIVSADAPAKRQVGQDAFAAWVRDHGDRLYISTVTIAEIEAGIARAIRIGATTKANASQVA